jgi:hypothetical protein
MKALSGLLLLSLLLGCGLPFSRPTPSENEDKERYLDMLDKGQIRDLRFTYDGWVGTASSIARFATDASGIERIRAAAQREDTYVPSSEATRRELLATVREITVGFLGPMECSGIRQNS